jgi:hypothetical protein
MIDKVKIQILAWLGGALLSSAGLTAQTYSQSWCNIDDIRLWDAALAGENAAGLHHLPIAGISYAEISANKSQGDFVNYFQSNNSLEFSAESESFYRLNPQTVFYGKIKYANFQGKNMDGSMLIDPYYNAFDIVEVTSGTAGDKAREDYLLTGAIAYDLSKRWTLGGKIDYEASNYAKHKDLRHTNSLLDFLSSLGLSYRLNPHIELGINYLYRKSVEDLRFKTYGTTDRKYTSLISFGNFFGKNELFGGDGYTDSDNSNPIVNNFNGASLQLHVKASDKWTVFNELSCRKREGYYGKRSTTTPVYSEHSAVIFAYRGQASWLQEQHRHDWRLSVEQEQLENFENIWRKDNNAGNRTDVVYFGDIKVLDKNLFHARLDYTAGLFVQDFHPEWKLHAGVDFCRRQQTVILYPYFRKQDIRVYNFFLSAEKQLIKNKNRYDFLLGASYGDGDGKAASDGSYAPGQTLAKSSDAHLYREYEYLTAPRLSGNTGIGYSRRLTESLRGYVRLQYEYIQALNINYLNGKRHHSVTLAAGCVF